MSPALRDALAGRRWYRRTFGSRYAPPAMDLRDMRRPPEWTDRDWPRLYGLAAYVPDPPLPLP